MNNLQSLFMTDIDTMIEVFELAKLRGKKAGDNCQDEFLEILKNKPDKFTYLGDTEQDIDLIGGNLRERGLKILNIKEIERRKLNEQY